AVSQAAVRKQVVSMAGRANGGVAIGVILDLALAGAAIIGAARGAEFHPVAATAALHNGRAGTDDEMIITADGFPDVDLHRQSERIVNGDEVVVRLGVGDDDLGDVVKVLIVAERVDPYLLAEAGAVAERGEIVTLVGSRVSGA